MHLDAGAQDIVRICQPQFPLAPAEQLGEDDAVIIVDLAETFNKNFPHLHGQIPNEPEQLLLGGLHVPHLGAEEFIALADLAIFLDGVHIDAAEGANPVFELGQAAGGRGHVLGRAGTVASASLRVSSYSSYRRRTTSSASRDAAAHFSSIRRPRAPPSPVRRPYPRLLAQ